MLSYYIQFLPNLSSILYPLQRNDTPWVLGSAQLKAFNTSKKLLLSSNCLTHFDSSLELPLACDASNFGLGAVLFHKTPDSSDPPIACTSQTLYTTTDSWRRRGWRTLWSKFHDYIFGCHFKLITDHKQDCATSTQASASSGRYFSLTPWCSTTPPLTPMPTC